MAVMGVVLERRAAPRAVAGRGREAAAAVGAEGGIGFGARTVGGARGTRETGDGRGRRADPSRLAAPASRVFSAQGSQGFRGVLGFQVIVIRVRELPRGAIKLDLFQGAERDGAGREIILGILPLVHPS